MNPNTLAFLKVVARSQILGYELVCRESTGD